MHKQGNKHLGEKEEGRLRDRLWVQLNKQTWNQTGGPLRDTTKVRLRDKVSGELYGLINTSIQARIMSEAQEGTNA